MKLYVHMREQKVSDGVLGPFTRYCLWVSGCHRGCPGCISPESHDMHAGTPYEAQALAWEVIASDVEGITVSGGEPFLQAEALCELIRAIRAHRDVGVIVYTGFLLEELDDVPGAKELIGLCDLIIDGPYVRELDDGKALRGSANQRVIALTPRYAEQAKRYGTGDRKVQIVNHAGLEIHYIGIPTDSEYAP